MKCLGQSQPVFSAKCVPVIAVTNPELKEEGLAQDHRQWYRTENRDVPVETLLMALSRTNKWNFSAMECDDGTGLLPISVTQAGAAQILAPGCPQIHGKLPSDPFPFWKRAGFVVPSCNSSPGHRRKASGVEVFLLELWSDGAQPGWGFSRCWDAIRPQPTPLPGGATLEPEGSASEHGRVPAETCPHSGAGWRAGWAINSPIVQMYSASRGEGCRHRLRRTGTGRALDPALRRARRRA